MNVNYKFFRLLQSNLNSLMPAINKWNNLPFQSNYFFVVSIYVSSQQGPNKFNYPHNGKW